MLVEGMGAADNLIFNPGELKNAELKLYVDCNDSIGIKWEIYPDVWFHGWNEEKYNTEPPVPLDCQIQTGKNVATFVTQRRAIQAYVYNKSGYFASTNTPFYVLNPK
jgi:hypothetical protein